MHGGLYYEPGSLKATLCVAGRQLLYDYCAVRGVTAKKLGKILVATSDDQVLIFCSMRKMLVHFHVMHATNRSHTCHCPMKEYSSSPPRTRVRVAQLKPAPSALLFVTLLRPCHVMPGVYGIYECSSLCLQVEQLRSIKDTAHQNGVTDVDWISVAEVGALEPAVQCVAALISPSTGVVDGRACAPHLRSYIEEFRP